MSKPADLEILTDAYADAYNRLNSDQKKAVDTIEGPVMVIAGPGTGKTQILTLRIAHILLKTDAKPENILALTFTESGASAMRERLLQYVGVVAYRVPIFTFHRFAQQLIAQYPDAYTDIIGGRPATDIEKIQYIQMILDSGTDTLLRPIGDPSYYVTHILRAISLLKQEYITPDAFALIIQKQETELLGIEKMHTKGAHVGKVRGEYQKKEKSILKNKELLRVYRQYKAVLKQDRVYDFDDMIVETIMALEQNPDMLLDLQEQYTYLLADEHQDVNGSQNRILELLASYHTYPNIFVVGDEKQAIFRFQGASLENFLYFENSFAHTKTISLTSNYRSGQGILDAAFSLIAVDDGPAKALRVPLVASEAKMSVVEKRFYSHQFYEDSDVVKRIQELIVEGVQLNEIAIIVRTNREVEQFASLLRKAQVAVEATADSDILSHTLTRTIFALIKVLVAPQDQAGLFTVLHGAYWGISNSDLVRVCSGSNYATPLYSIISNRELLRELCVEFPEVVLQVASVLEKTRAQMVTQSPQRVLEYVLQESGLLSWIMQSDPIEGGRIVRRIYDEVEEMSVRNDSATLFEVQQAFALRSEYNLPLNAPTIATYVDAVRVMTAHKSKGLEFEYVFIPHMVDSLWGGSTQRTYFDIPLLKHLNTDDFNEMDDERRLLYVSLTRAKKAVYISHAQTNQTGKSFLPSRLLEEIHHEYISECVTEHSELTSDPLVALEHRDTQRMIDPELLKKILSERGLSATALNNYLQSPFDYLYRNVLRMPEVQALPMQFGTVLHNVMQTVTTFHTQEQKLPSPTKIKEYLERELDKMPFTKEEYVRFHEKGYEALLKYIEYIAPSLPKQTREEFGIKVYFDTGIPDFPQVLLTGKLDRLDFDVQGNVVRVVDYKSGKPKTRNEIEGNTKSSNGDYKRQLTFYALLLGLYKDERYTCTVGVLSFIESDAKGIIHEETFTISNEEIEALKKEIVGVVLEISTGSFLQEPCDPNVSNYCHLVSMLDGKRGVK